MRLWADGKAYDLPKGSSLEDLWKVAKGERSDEEAVLGLMDGDVVDFNTPIEKDGTVTWIPLHSAEGYRAYSRSAVFLLVCAVKKLHGPSSDIKVQHALGKSLYCEFKDGHHPLQKELNEIEKEMEELTQISLDIETVTVGKDKVVHLLLAMGRNKEADLLSKLDTEEITVDRAGGIIDYFLGPLLPNMSFLSGIRLKSYAPGFLIEMTKFKEEEPDVDSLFAGVFLESKRWSERIGCHNLLELNEAIENGRIYDFIAMAEAFQEKKIAELSDYIVRRSPKTRLICIAGPSSSGKTTFMKRLIIHLKVNGAFPVMLSLDDYFKNRNELSKEDWENLSAIDLSLFEEVVTDLMEGKKRKIPHFNFLTGEREWGEEVELREDQPIIIEGLHALNPKISYFVPGYQCVKVYLNALTQLGINDHNRISTTDTRLLRRMVRDAKFRGHKAEHTLELWESVRQGEERNIFSCQGEADVVFNTALLYEIPVLKTIALPLLQEISKESAFYEEAQRLLSFLRPFLTLPTSVIPSQSLLREFIGYEGLGTSFLNLKS